MTTPDARGQRRRGARRRPAAGAAWQGARTWGSGPCPAGGSRAARCWSRRSCASCARRPGSRARAASWSGGPRPSPTTHHFVILAFEVTVLDRQEPAAGDDAASARWVPLSRGGRAAVAGRRAGRVPPRARRARHHHLSRPLARCGGGAQRPFHSGLRFSMKAVRPSLVSSDDSTAPNPASVIFFSVVLVLPRAGEHDLAALPDGERGVLGDLLGQLDGGRRWPDPAPPGG